MCEHPRLIRPDLGREAYESSAETTKAALHLGRPSEEVRLNAGSSAAQSKLLDQRTVTCDVGVLEVAEQTAALTHHEEQATTRVVVVLVVLEVFGEVLDALRQHSDLHLGGSGVTGVRRVLFHDRLLSVRFECHRWDPLSVHCAAPGT